MNIRIFPPSPPLRKFIRCYYYIENTQDELITYTFFADGCIEVVFSVGWDFYKDGVKEDCAKIIGQIIKPRKLNITGKGQSFGIWFYPHTFSYFTKIPVFELNDLVLPWSAVFPGSFADVVGNCMCERRFDQLVNAADNFLLKKISEHNGRTVDKITDAAVQYLCQHKSRSDLNALASLLNVSQRYLQKAFQSRIGITQKQFLRIQRFQQVLQSLGENKLPNLTALAYDHDFYDQSHFVREFKAFTGIVPSEFELSKLPINQHFISAP